MSNKPQHITSQTKGKPAHKADNSQVVVNAYREAFGKHYPHHALEIKPGKSRDGERVYHVIIGGDKGDRPLTLDDMREATAAFLH